MSLEKILAGKAHSFHLHLYLYGSTSLSLSLERKNILSLGPRILRCILPDQEANSTCLCAAHAIWHLRTCVFALSLCVQPAQLACKRFVASKVLPGGLLQSDFSAELAIGCAATALHSAGIFHSPELSSVEVSKLANHSNGVARIAAAAAAAPPAAPAAAPAPAPAPAPAAAAAALAAAAAPATTSGSGGGSQQH